MRLDSLGRRISPAQHAHKTKHGYFGTATYRAWCAMKARCLRPSCKSYEHYGARGIKVCERWMTFENFLADMGERPKGLSLDRINNDGNYEPGNCRWTDWTTQRHNQRPGRIRLITFRGETLPIKEWAERLGIVVPALMHRLDVWPLERALTAPKAPGRKK